MNKLNIINDSGKIDQLENISGIKWITPTKFLLNGKIHTIDPNEQSFEMFNGSKATIIMENVHPFEKGVHVKVRPNEFAFFQHKYYVPWIDYIGNPTKEKIENIIINYGNEMFKQNKKASAPDNWSKSKR